MGRAWRAEYYADAWPGHRQQRRGVHRLLPCGPRLDPDPGLWRSHPSGRGWTSWSHAEPPGRGHAHDITLSTQAASFATSAGLRRLAWGAAQTAALEIGGPLRAVRSPSTTFGDNRGCWRKVFLKMAKSVKMMSHARRRWALCLRSHGQFGVKGWDSTIHRSLLWEV